MLSYTDNYKKNLILYWRQFYPTWTIPKGYHVHHIKPKCTFDDKNDPRIHHPRNLIALHPDDHALIHKLRGDKWSASCILGIKGRVISDSTREKLSNASKGRILSEEHKDKISATTKGRKGKPCTDEIKQKIREARTKQIMQPVSEETKIKISNANKGRKLGPQSLKTKSKKSKIMKKIWADKRQAKQNEELNNVR